MTTRRRVGRSRLVATVLAGLMLTAGCTASGADHEPSSSAATAPSDTPSTGAPSSTRSSAPPASESSACTVAAAGDIAGEDFQDGAARTASLISGRRPRAVVAVGDTAYDEGSSENYADYYEPTWGAFKDITFPVPGNHEYESDGTGFAEYFGKQALSNRGVDICGWRVLLVNEYEGVDAGAEFVAQQARTRPGVPFIVVWHQPRFSSGDEHGSDPDMKPLWEAAAAARAPIVLNGHDHDYERFAPLDAAGDPAPGGTTEFVTGLGGHHIRDFGDIEAYSEVRFTGTPAVLFLTLRHDGYSWEERAVDGRLVDRGTATLPSLRQ